MADNTTLPGTGDVIAADEIGGVKHQLVKIEFGAADAATPVSAADPLPVTASGTVAVSNFPVSYPVTGTFYQATQPVSAAALPLPAGAATDLGLANIFARLADGSVVALVSGSVSVTNFPASQAVTGTFWQATQPVSIAATVAVSGTFWQATQPVSIASMPSTPVTGTFWQATQPVSGPLTDTQLRATPVPVSGTVAVTGPLTDTQLRASAVPVSLASLPALATGANVIGAVTQSGTWNIGSITTLPALAAGAAIVGKFGIDQTTPGTTNAVAVSTLPTLTKGTQGTTGVSTQDLKDAGRSAKVLTLDSFAVAATAETIMTMSVSTDNGVVTTGTSYTVTAGKRLRILCVSAGLHTIAGNTTAVNVIVRIRTIATAPALVASPLQVVLPIQGIAAANQAGMPAFIDFPDGWELPAGAGLAVTVACAGFVATTAAPKVDITINAYEY